MHRSTHEVRGRAGGSLHGATASGTWDGTVGDDLWFRFPEDRRRFEGRWLAGSPCARVDGSTDG